MVVIDYIEGSPAVLSLLIFLALKYTHTHTTTHTHKERERQKSPVREQYPAQRTLHSTLS